MPAWQGNREYMLRVGIGAAVTIVGFVIVMTLYGAAGARSEENLLLADEIETLADDLGRNEANELGRKESLLRKWREVAGQVLHETRPEFTYTEDPGVRFIEDKTTRGGTWRDRFKKANMEIDDSVYNLGFGAEFTRDTSKTSENIIRLDMIDRVMEAIQETDLRSVTDVEQRKMEVLPIPVEDSDQAIVLYPATLRVEGPFSRIASFIRSLQRPGRYIHVGDIEVRAGGQDSVQASIQVSAMRVLARSDVAGEERSHRQGRPRRGGPRRR
jgi:hypothetical protein